jgi:hypothetical protein
MTVNAPCMRCKVWVGTDLPRRITPDAFADQTTFLRNLRRKQRQFIQ